MLTVKLQILDKFCVVEGDDLKIENPKKAIEMFEKVVQLENNLGDQVKWFYFQFESFHIVSFSQYTGALKLCNIWSQFILLWESMTK
jgi:hypothetical protein